MSSLSKPRRRGITAMIDFGPDSFGWTGPHGIEDVIGAAGDYIDFAKIYALNALLMPEPVTKAVVARYRDADIRPYAGGNLFEFAWRRRAMPEFISLMTRLGFPSLEISENYVTLTPDERMRLFEDFSRHGIEVIYEFGRKSPTEPMSIDLLANIVAEVRGAGVGHIILEQSELDLLVATDAEAYDKLNALPWFADILIEADPYRFPKQHVELIDKLGPEVNLANIPPGQCLRLEGLRRGIGRAVDYSVLRLDDPVDLMGTLELPRIGLG